MSLINDALKKAARQRAGEPSDAPPVPGGGKRPARRGRAMSTQSIILICAAALALVVVSAVVTGMLVGGKPAPKPLAAPAAQAPKLPPAVVQAPPAVPVQRTPSPVPTAPPILPAPLAAQAAPAPAPVVALPPSPGAAARPAPAQPVPAAVAGIPAGVQPQGRGEQAQAFVDSLRISGVRSAGADSKVLINGHVYRVNEVLDRALGIKLVSVDLDHLTFTDADGATYRKGL